ncbi:MAG: FtsQ-type POTRA domain-containing protein [Candidatus Hydrogenedentes bacterium]|nr:FtsQ-type POTRA domain-containing protein [Candidatus Hydrogenedentota bacterium]
MSAPKTKPREKRISTRVRRRGAVLLVASLFIALAVFALLGSSVYRYALASPRFQIQRISIVGLTQLDPERVRNAAGITAEDNIWFFDAAAVADRVGKLPYVKDCTVERGYPDKVILYVEERIPVAVLEVSNRAYAVDDEGVILEEVDVLNSTLKPLVTNVPGLGYVEPGHRIAQPEYREALNVWKAYCAAGLDAQWTLSELSAGSTNEIAMIVNEVPFRLLWGRSDFVDYSVQAQRLAFLWEQKNGVLPCANSLDLRFDRDFVCK